MVVMQFVVLGGDLQAPQARACRPGVQFALAFFAFFVDAGLGGALKHVLFFVTIGPIYFPLGVLAVTRGIGARWPTLSTEFGTCRNRCRPLRAELG